MGFIYPLLLVLCLSLLPASAVNVEIGLGDYQDEATISSTTDYRLVNRKTGAVIGDFYALSEVRLVSTKGSIKLINGYEPVGAFKGPIEMVTMPPKGKEALVSVNDKWYRGTFRFFPTKVKKSFWAKENGFSIVNKIDMNDYLKGVVPSEMPASWHGEALKVQAVCARTYTLSKLNRRRELGYDLKSTVEDQAYLGYQHEKPSTNRAIELTKDQILVDNNGRIVEAYYTSSAGGYTDAIEDVWDVSPLSYIVPRKSYDDNSPHYRWRKEFDQEEISRMLEDFKIGMLVGLKVLSRTKAERVKDIALVGTKKNTYITGEELRHQLGLKSSKFNFGIQNGKMVFAGRGFGHGLGMSQYGSKALAERGLAYKDILKHYYPGTKLMSI